MFHFLLNFSYQLFIDLKKTFTEVVDADDEAGEVDKAGEVDGSGKVEKIFDVRGGLFENQETDWDCRGSLIIFHLPAESEKV